MSTQNDNIEIIDSTEVIELDPYENVDVITDIVFEGKKDVTIKDIGYMCDHLSKMSRCDECPLNCGRTCGYAIILRKFETNDEINKSVLNWLNDNPPTSYLTDIKERMPTVEIDRYNIPNFCVQSIYGKDCCNCLTGDISKFDKANMLCRKCWRTPIEEEYKKEYY